MIWNLSTILVLVAVVGTVGAFTPLSVGQTKTSQTTSQLAAFPYDDEKMPFYALGANFALQVGELNLKELLEGDEIDVVLQAFRDTLRGQVGQTEQQKILMTYGNDLNEILTKRRGQMADRPKKEGQAFADKFLEENPDAIKTDTGLVFLETKEGDGVTPTVESTVTVHYHGTLIDGTVVDSSLERDDPFTFKATSAIKGWTEGLLRMKEGGKATLVIPSDLGYGDEGSGGVIEPGASLKFDVELLKVESPEDEETELLDLPDGTQLRVPKGVKMRLVDEEEQEE